MSESRRLARSLVEPEPLSMESRFPRAESIERLRRAARAFHTTVEGERVSILAPSARLEARWEGPADDLRLVGEFRPGRRTGLALRILSFIFLLLLAASGWLVWATETGAARFLVPLLTLLGVLALPFIVTGMASTGEADRSRIKKALRVALRDEQEGYKRVVDDDD